MTLRTVHFRNENLAKEQMRCCLWLCLGRTQHDLVRTTQATLCKPRQAGPLQSACTTAGGQWPVSRCIIDTSRSAHCAMTRTPISSWAYPSPHCRQPEQQQEQRLGRAHHPTLGIRAHLPHQCQRSSRRLPPVPTELPTRTRTRFRSHHSIDDRWAREGRSS